MTTNTPDQTEFTAAEIEAMRKTWKPSHNPWLIALAVTAGAFMEVLDTTIVNVSLPHIAGTLGCSYDDSTWALTSYLVANGIVLLLSPWLSKYFGRKRYFVLCIAMFTILSILCGMVTSLAQLVILRCLQGIFGGGLQPSSQAIVLDIFPPEKRGAVFGLQAMAMIVGPVLGPVLGGWLTDDYSWRYVFWVNAPFGALTLIAVMLLVQDPPWVKAVKERLDVIGVALLSVGLGCLEVMSDRGQDLDWFGSPFITYMGVLGGLGLLGSLIWLTKAKDPIISLEVFKDRNFTLSWIMLAVMGAILYSSGTLVPKFAQQVLGYTPTWAGLIMAPGGLTIMACIPVVGKLLMPKIPLKWIILAGFIAWGYGLFYTGHLTPNISFHSLVIYRMWQSAPLALLFAPISTAAYFTLKPSLNSDASALMAMARCYIGSQALSLSTAAETDFAQNYQRDIVSHLPVGSIRFVNHFAGLKAYAMEHGLSAYKATQYAWGAFYKEVGFQSQVLAANEVFGWLCILCLLMIPLCTMLSSGPENEGEAPPVH